MLDRFLKYKVKEFLTLEEYKQRIGEGLIRTHSLEYTSDYIMRYLSRDYKALVNSESSTISIFKKNTTTNDEFLLKIMNNLGYYLSAYFKDDEFLPLTYNKNDYEALRFEPKFDLGINNYGKYLYHVTDKKHLPKIVKIGLTPKTKSKITAHPDRIYLALNKKALGEIFELFVNGNFIEEPVILRIRTSGLNNVFLIDSQFKGGVYTHHNIPRENIEIIEFNDIY